MHRKPLYNGTTFHRVIPEFMVQGGDPLATGEGDPGYSFNDEFNANLNFDVAGRLAMAMDVDRRLDGADLCAPGPLWLATSRRPPGPIGESVRIGITREVDRKLRFFERDNAFVSGPRRMRD